MSKFIEIKPNIFVNSEEIEAVIGLNDPKKPDILSKVYTHHNDYPSILPANAIIQMMTSDDNDSNEETQEQMLNILKQQQHFVG